jgi:hypothetical protein
VTSCRDRPCPSSAFPDAEEMRKTRGKGFRAGCQAPPFAPRHGRLLPSTMPTQQLRHGLVPAGHGQVQGRLAAAIPSVDVRPGGEQQPRRGWFGT